jgi:hypothetical protein
MEEVWKQIEGFEGIYDVSNLGRVRRLYAGGLDGWRILKPGLNKTGTGYYQMALCKDGNVRRNVLVHHLVAAAFIGPRPSGMLVCHNDGNSQNNAVSNLRYDTMSANQYDRSLHGTDNKGGRHGMSKLTDEQVAEIKVRYEPGLGRKLATEYGVAPHTITRIAAGKTWTHV